MTSQLTLSTSSFSKLKFVESRPPSPTQADWSRLQPDPKSPTSVSDPVFPCLAL
ncbi:hypothetical protein RchiOBHm_Chr7g0184021 [Rosa chinensis]|uniref:Uncharacterized protein n=1 Tax=Rosa chinensis TaxID=74649 RepID=A0A2P6P3A9_ROSCH|nr:hypothetical protein RchiOBHm_Chr7g0184021 [Rosa chinensis]